MKKKLLAVVILTMTTSFYANADWVSNKKEELIEKGKGQLKEEVVKQLDKNCLKLPIGNYYFCMPVVNADWLDRI